tara:strand:- start:885 stop:1145 length:261 start_codon:yes stop_codon:yes gene_type:complete
MPASGVLTLSNIKVTPVIKEHKIEYFTALMMIATFLTNENKAIKKNIIKKEVLTSGLSFVKKFNVSAENEIKIIPNKAYSAKFDIW